MSNQDQKAPNNSTNQSQQQPPYGYPYQFPNQPQSNQNNNLDSNNNSNQPNNNNNNQQGNGYPPNYQFQPPYGYPYPYPPQFQQPSNNADKSNNGQNQGQMPPGYPYPPYPYPFPPPNQSGQQGQGNQNQPPFPYPPYGFPYPYPFPPPPQGQGNSNQPPYPYPPYGFPYPYPPQQQQQQQPPQPQQQQQQRQSPQHELFDWERRGLSSNNNNNYNSNFNNNNNSNGTKQPATANHSLFDWEKGNTEPQKPVEIDWNYKSEYDVPEVPPEVERDPSISVACKSKAFDPSSLPALDESFFKLTPSEVAAQIKASTQRQTFRPRNKTTSKEIFQIKFQFSEEPISDLFVNAQFHIKEKTCKLYEFLNEFVFNEGTKFIIKTTVPPKAIGNNQNQQLKDVKITGNTILFVKISEFTGIKEHVKEQYLLQKQAIEECLKDSQQENQEQAPQ